MAASTSKNSSSELDKKAEKFEWFIDEVLREHLKKVYEQRAKLCDDAGEYLRLKNYIIQMKSEKLSNNRAQVDIGCNFYCEAEIDPECEGKVNMCLGMGLFMELTYDETIEYIEQKEKIVERRIKHYSDQCAEIKARIQVALQTLGELQGINTDAPAEPVNIWG